MRKFMLMAAAGFMLSNPQMIIAAEKIDRVIERLTKPEQRREAARQIEKEGKAAGRHLRRFAKDRKNDRNSRVAAIALIGRIKDDEATEDLEGLLENDGDQLCREASAMALGNLGNRKTIRTLKNALKDESPNVRMRSVWALAKLGDTSGKELAMQAIREEENATEKMLAAEALGAVGDKSCISELQQNPSNSNLAVRWYSKVAIKQIEMSSMSESEIIQYLAGILNGPNMNNWTSVQLAMIGTPEAVKALKDIAADPHSNGQPAAQKVLDKLDPTTITR
jgi:HEAT repeat protein